ncbi:TetR/AcrR family transcriptional regulator [Enterococcus sp. BWT-B8]|uniref:TetR/AcrR family transcriptional regulator n=1 Tax=unclassified Enterococcus TaxID=2608891 RepID=UPI001E36229C|nr:MULTISPECIES: TetR/AcrR family transcriptional regulator [unclassified Enterococcus]MCB5950596.1 TetR/AcrR family transcriptional regulator [Enterococcus sp. BWT-B8]MCB5955920.1 TetR/AcrR family transcriptional regulator [Enterococcus sp. CWB-B31]
MVRKKVYTKDQILNASYNIILKEGFSGITARNVAEKMGISTQPIYLEFTNMEDLKVTLLTMIHGQLEKQYFYNKTKGDPVIDLGINIIEFAKKDRRLFMYLYIDHHGYGKMLKELSYQHFEKQIQTSLKYQKLAEELIKRIHEKIWITAAGIATLYTTNTAGITENEVCQLLEESIQKYSSA